MIEPTSFSMTQQIIDSWAELSGDFNPLHVDVEFARGTRFGGTIAHGHITVSLVAEHCLRSFGPDWLRRGSLVDIRFRAPVRPEHAYDVRFDEDPDADGRWRFTVLPQDGDTVCVAGIVAFSA